MNQAISFDSLSTSAKQLSAQVILDTADIVCRLWPDGDIDEVVVRTTSGQQQRVDELDGRQMREVIHSADVSKLDAMIADAIAGRPSTGVTLRHTRLPDWCKTARYSAHLAGDEQKLVLIGTVETVEIGGIEQAVADEIMRSSQQFRAASAQRYTALFEISTEGLILADVAKGRIEMANRNAADLLGVPREILQGSLLRDHIPEFAVPDLLSGGECTMDIKAPGAQARTITLSVRQVRSFGLESLVIRMQRRPGPLRGSPIIGFLKRFTDTAILLTDDDGTIAWANLAASNLVPQASSVGAPISTLLSVPQDVLDGAMKEAADHVRVLSSLSAIGGTLPDGSDAHVTIVASREDGALQFGFLLQPIAFGGQESADDESAAGSEVLDALLDSASMKTLVRRSTSVLERDCIEAALRLTGNNRAAAAKALGLSRQGLYSKLRQHDLI
ncbi:MAG: helix-turn-helix domain-containing protein [Pseudomonadota bacterium]